MCSCKKMKIGIITYHRACNYGAFLQARALCNRLNEENDLEAEIIDFRMKKELMFYSVDRCRWTLNLKRIVRQRFFFEKKLFDSFEKAQNEDPAPKSGRYLLSDRIKDFQEFVRNQYDVIIAGSDEIWKVNSFRGFPTPYWLMGDLGCRKFAYAASARVDFKECLDVEKFRELKAALDDFEFIGVRDQLTYDAVKNIISKKKESTNVL